MPSLPALIGPYASSCEYQGQSQGAGGGYPGAWLSVSAQFMSSHLLELLRQRRGHWLRRGHRRGASTWTSALTQGDLPVLNLP
jgi:hypothetical protein